MKSFRPVKPSPTTREKIAALRLQVATARKRTESARATARKAKVELKRARKAFKHAKRVAKAERRQVKALKKMLAAAATAKRPKAPLPIRAKKTLRKVESSGGRKKPKPTRMKETKPAEVSSAALSLGDQSSSGATLGAISAPVVSPDPVNLSPREAPPSGSSTGP